MRKNSSTAAIAEQASAAQLQAELAALKRRVDRLESYIGQVAEVADYAATRFVGCQCDGG